MTTIAVDDKIAGTLSQFGDLQESVNAALQRYTIDQISARIQSLHRKCNEFESKYGLKYEVFAKRTAEDEAFVAEVEKSIDNLWETDLTDWEFCMKGINDWTEELKRILLK